MKNKRVFYFIFNWRVFALRGFRGFLVAQMVKNLSPMQKTQVQFLGQEFSSSLEKEMATHSSILAWRIPWTEEPDRGIHATMGLQRVRHD